MKVSDEERYQEARSFLRAKLAEPQPKIDEWLNAIVDQWVAARKARKSPKRHV